MIFEHPWNKLIARCLNDLSPTRRALFFDFQDV